MEAPNTQGSEQSDIVTISMPAELLDVLIDLLTAAKQQKAQKEESGEESPLEGFGEEVSGSTRKPMQSIPR